jgi:uncharacterized protein
MTALYVTYSLELPDGGRRALAIHLQPAEGEETPTHEPLRDLHKAVDVWNATRPEIFVRSDLGVAPAPGALRRMLADYQYADGNVNGGRLGRHLDMLLEDGRIHTFSLRPGAPVEGRDLVGRRDAIEALQQRLVSGSVHLAAPRRYGKTSILRQLKKMLTEEKQPCLYIDVSPGISASWLLVTLVQEAMEDAYCRRSLETVPELADWPEPDAGPRQRSLAGRRLEKSLGTNVRNAGRRLLSALGNAGAILLVDEFSVFLRRALDRSQEQAKLIAELLAQSRREPKPTRQVLAGSAGLKSFLLFHGLADPFSDLKTVPLPPLGRQDAAVLTEELLYSERQCPSPQVVQEILTQIGAPIPFFLHALIDAIREKSMETGRLDSEIVHWAYRVGLLGSRGNAYFREYKLDHQPYPKSLLRAAAALLLEVARRPKGVPQDQLREIFGRKAQSPDGFESLLSCLQEDYDLTEHDGRWAMRSKVLRERWSQEEAWLTGEY